MKIVHLCLGNFYVDNHTYQENLLPKAHKQLGYDVEIIAGTFGFDNESIKENSTKIGTYINEYGIKVTRLKYRWNNWIGRILKFYNGTFNAIHKARPDIIFIHGCQFGDLKKVVKYKKKHSKVKIYIDNHADFNNSGKNWLSKHILHHFLWKKLAQEIEPYTTKFYGVIPIRVKFLTEIYKLPSNKCELLELGVDDELVKKSISPQTRSLIRNKYGIEKNVFLITTGGKINWARPETLNLMEAVNNLNIPNVQLLIFGKISEELKECFYKLCESPNIKFIGWINAEESHSVMAASDLVVFPGLHSVMWEQACALGIPCIFKDLDDVKHIDLGGNALFLKDISSKTLGAEIEKILNNPEKYKQMKEIAQTKGYNKFSYLEIAKRSVAW